MGQYRTIVADPPWDHPDSGKRTQSQAGNWNRKWLGYESKVPYARMSLDEIKALPVADLADPAGAHLYLWTTNGFLRRSFEVLDVWGFKFSTVLTWCKSPMGLGLGGAYSITTEFLLFARKGKLAPLSRMDSTWWQVTRPYNNNGAPAHSAKPEAFLDRIEQVSPGPYVELFARRARFGWDYWGNESLGTAEMAA